MGDEWETIYDFWVTDLKSWVTLYKEMLLGHEKGATFIIPHEIEHAPQFKGPVSLGGVVTLVPKLTYNYSFYVDLHKLNYQKWWEWHFKYMLHGDAKPVKCSKADLKKGRGQLEWDPEAESFQYFKYV